MTVITSRKQPPGPADAHPLAEREPLPRYSRRSIIGTWVAAALPMAALVWIGAPLMAGSFDGPSAWPRAILLCLTVGLVWQFVFVMIAVRVEQGSLRWSVLKDALWLRAPRSPRTGRRGGRLWWVLVPLIFLVAAKEELPRIPRRRSTATKGCSCSPVLARSSSPATGCGSQWSSR